jgi:hypothetical protein
MLKFETSVKIEMHTHRSSQLNALSRRLTLAVVEPEASVASSAEVAGELP